MSNMPHINTKASWSRCYGPICNFIQLIYVFLTVATPAELMDHVFTSVTVPTVFNLPIESKVESGVVIKKKRIIVMRSNMYPNPGSE